MTRFGEILPLWQNFASLWQIIDGLFLICKILILFWRICFIIGIIFIVTSGQILKNNLTMWSHGFSCSFVYWTSTYLGSGCTYKWRVCIEIDDSAAAAAAGDCDFLQSFSLTDFSLSNKDLIETKIRSIELITNEYITQNFAMSSPERFRLWVSLCCYISFFNMFVYLCYYSECDQMLKQKK